MVSHCHASVRWPRIGLRAQNVSPQLARHQPFDLSKYSTLFRSFLHRTNQRGHLRRMCIKLSDSTQVVVKHTKLACFCDGVGRVRGDVGALLGQQEPETISATGCVFAYISLYAHLSAAALSQLLGSLSPQLKAGEPGSSFGFVCRDDASGLSGSKITELAAFVMQERFGLVPRRNPEGPAEGGEVAQREG